MIKTILIATTNQGKAREISGLLHLPNFQIDFITLDDLKQKGLEVVEAPEKDNTFTQIARAKARYYALHTGLPTIAEDSGLVIPSLNGQPGIYSKRFGKTDAERINKILKKMSSIPSNKRQAHFICVAAIAHPKTGRSRIFVGKIHGHISSKPSGMQGFGYDPIFYYAPLKKTFAQIDTITKNRYSHRYRAFTRLKAYLPAFITQN